MKMILMAGVAVLATAAVTPAMAAQQGAAATNVAVPNNVLLADWKGPYGGVPPWDQVKAEQFDEAILCVRHSPGRGHVAAAVKVADGQPLWETPLAVPKPETAP